ncbi:MAG: hypothetical protein QNJ84_02080 [Alphaproteobacteria bacterium]|nr:hypothetical protein [Alphaproteobacteria bacterium]
MFITFLRFAGNKSKAAEFMDAHNRWIAKGFSDGVFLAVGSIKPAAGGVILARGEAPTNYEARIASDPFVAHCVVAAETVEMDPKRSVPELDFLKVGA